MRELSVLREALLTLDGDDPGRMNLGTILPTEAEVSALVATIRENAERRAWQKDTPEERQRFLETYVPLEYEVFCRVVRDYDGLLIELSDEEQREKNEHERQRRALQDREIELEEREIDRAERQYLERVKRREEDQILDGFLHSEAKTRQKIFDRREILVSKKQQLADERFTVEDPNYIPRRLIVGLETFMREQNAADYAPTLESYKEYLRSLGEGYSDAIDSLHQKSAFPEEIRNFHSLVVAPTGWGKSELLKQIMFHYVKHKSAGVLLIDPGGDLARQVMRWPKLVETDRLVVVDPQISRGLTVGINPFDGLGIRDEDDRKALASEWAHILGAITDDLSAHMRRVIINCIRVLLGWHKSATLMDLKYLLGDPEQSPKTSNKELQDTFGGGRKTDPLAQARMRRKGELHEFARNHPDLEVRSFFREEFDSLSVTSTRQSLRARIDIVMQIPFAQSMLVGKQTFDLKRTLEERKVVIVNLEGFGSKEDIKAIGCLFLGMVSAVGRKRGIEDIERRVPIQVIVDEAAELASPVVMEILTQLRKYRVHITLAQQLTKSLTPAHRETMIANTRVKMVAPATREAAEMLDLDRKIPEFKALADRQFWVRWGEKAEPVRLAVASELADTRHQVSLEAFRGHLERGRAAGLYREAIEPPAVAVPAVAAPEPATAQESPPAAVSTVLEEPPPAAEKKPAKRPTKAAKPVSSGRRKATKPKLFPVPEPGVE